MTLDKLKLILTVPEQNILCIYRKETLQETKNNLIENLLLLETEAFNEYDIKDEFLKDEYKFILKKCIYLLENIDEVIFKEYISTLEIEDEEE